jgi:hypothetical protein
MIKVNKILLLILIGLSLNASSIDELIKNEMGVLDKINPSDFTLNNVSTQISDKIKTLPTLEGIKDLNYINNLNKVDFGNFNMNDLGSNLDKFKFNKTELSSLSTIKSNSSGNTAKDKVQELILLNGKLNEQFSGQNIKTSQLLMLYNQELIEWEETLHNNELINKTKAIK